MQLPAFALAIASADASFRRYFRVTPATRWAGAPDAVSLIAMDAPPAHEDCRPFVHVARLLEQAGVHAPRVLASDLARGYLLLTDLGTTTYSHLRSMRRRRDSLYGDAIDALIRWQRASREGELPPYDEALLRARTRTLPRLVCRAASGRALSELQRASLGRAFDVLVANNLGQPRVFVHRDYHSRNLMVAAPNPGVLDFQDAVYGPITYDLVSLLARRLCRVGRRASARLGGSLLGARAQRGSAGRHDFAAFWRDFEWMGIQRQLKVLGIFARLYHRDGKAGYVDDMPRVMAYLRAHGTLSRVRCARPRCSMRSRTPRRVSPA